MRVVRYVTLRSGPKMRLAVVSKVATSPLVLLRRVITEKVYTRSPTTAKFLQFLKNTDLTHQLITFCTGSRDNRVHGHYGDATPAVTSEMLAAAAILALSARCGLSSTVHTSEHFRRATPWHTCQMWQCSLAGWLRSILPVPHTVERAHRHLIRRSR